MKLGLSNLLMCSGYPEAMEEEKSIDNPTQLMEAASEFTLYPGTHSDSSAKDFLHRFPLPFILNALQTKSDVAGLEDALGSCLERVFRTRYGASLIPHFMSFVVMGLGADSYRVRVLACKTVSCLLENSCDNTTAAQLIVEYNVFPLLLNCLIVGDEQIAAASMDTIKTLSGSLYGMDIVFPADPNDAAHLKNLVVRCSSLGRVRVLALIVKLLSISSTVASVVYKSNFLNLLIEEVHNVNDMLIALSVLELLYEGLAEIPHGTEFLSRTTLLQLLSSIIRNSLAESILRSRSMMISGRLLSKENVFTFTDESSVSTVISAIDGRFGLLESQDADEFECALEALGNIGLSVQGATLLLSSAPPAARHVVNAAFNLQGRGKQLAALHALGNISGETRSGNNTILNDDAEENLRCLIYKAASKSSKLTPSGLFLSVLQQESDLRLAGYRLIKGLVVRQWCLMEICSRQELINIVTDNYTEGTKIGMDSRYNCCLAIHKAFVSSTLISDPSLAGVTVKLQEAVKNGPYLARKHSQAQPVVMTEDRF